jgi:hypothetical protein
MAESGLANVGDAVHFSTLEASLANIEIVPRENSIEMNDVYRHAQPGDADANELDFDFDLDTSDYPLANLRSLQEVFSAVQHQTHLQNPKNFSLETRIQCFETTGESSSMHATFYHL